MYCPKCKAEYREGFTKCSECQVDLVNELPKEPKKEPEKEIRLATVATYLTSEVATIAQGVLRSNDIEAEIFKDDVGGTRPGLTFATGVKLVVNEEELKRAVAILKEAQSG